MMENEKQAVWERAMPKFQVVSDYQPSGGSPIKAGLLRGNLDMTETGRQSPLVSRFWLSPKRLHAADAALGPSPLAGRRPQYTAA